MSQLSSECFSLPGNTSFQEASGSQGVFRWHLPRALSPEAREERTMPATEEKGKKGHRTKPHKYMSVGIQLYHSLPAVHCPHTLDVTVLAVVNGVSTVIYVFLHLGFL